MPEESEILGCPLNGVNTSRKDFSGAILTKIERNYMADIIEKAEEVTEDESNEKIEIRKNTNQPIIPSDDSFLLTNTCLTTTGATSILYKKIIEHLYKKIDYDKIKVSYDYCINLVKTNRHILFQNYISTFGDIITINHQFGILKYKDCYIIIHNSDCTYITEIYIYIYSSNSSSVKSTLQDFKNHLDVLSLDKVTPKVAFTWYTFIDGRIQSFFQYEFIDDIFHPEAYPYFDNINKLIKDYISADAPILFLRGCPGTGKTRFIREILRHLYLNKTDADNIDCMYTSSKEVIENGSIFLKLIFSDSNVLILEDIDYHLTPRKDGNTSLYSLLSVSNGIMSNSIKNKKIILSTNLPNMKNVDEALVRPGRCFKILDMKKLSPEQASNLSEKIGKKLVIKQDKYTLADIYNS